MSFFRRLFGQVSNKQDIPELTNFLAQNETFKQAAKNIHNKKKNFFNDIDSYLESELLGKKKEQVKRIADKNNKES